MEWKRVKEANGNYLWTNRMFVSSVTKHLTPCPNPKEVFKDHSDHRAVFFSLMQGSEDEILSRSSSNVKAAEMSKMYNFLNSDYFGSPPNSCLLVINLNKVIPCLPYLSFIICKLDNPVQITKDSCEDGQLNLELLVSDTHF